MHGVSDKNIMVFAEKKTNDNNWQYTCEDLFGTAVFTSSLKLDGDILDAAITAVTGVQTTAATVTGDMPYKDSRIFYKLNKAPLWESETTEEAYKPAPCTLTSAQVLKCWMRRVSWPGTRFIKWCCRFAAALRQAWQNTI